MNWFKFLQLLLVGGSAAADMFVKNEQSKKTKDAVIHLATIAITGLATQNPDGTPATEAFDPAKMPAVPKL